jgi:flagellar biosynthesis protein FlhF
MRIKKFIAKSLKEGKQKIIQELGEDAVILSSRTVKKSGNGGIEVVEIVAAIDDSPLKQKRTQKAPATKAKEIPSAAKYELESGENRFFRVAGELYNELNEIKSSLTDISDSVRFIHSGIFTDIIREIYLALRKAEISEELALQIAGNLTLKGNINNFSEALTEARILVTEHIKIQEPVKKDSGRIVVFVGPTGCGKTSSLIKIALVSKLVLQSNVLVVSADTHKVGGVEQLQTYASIGSLPFEVVYSPDELQNLISKEIERDIILIDTAGYSPFNQGGLKEIGQFIDKIEADHIYLVQSFTMSHASFIESYKEYSVLQPDAIVLTKVDEAPAIGEVISALKEVPLPLAYFSTGQKIPEDIEPAGRKKLSMLVLPDELALSNSGKKL